MSITNLIMIGILCAAACSTTVLLFLIRKPQTPRWMDVATAIMLFLFAAMFLGMLGAIHGVLPNTSNEEKDILNQYQVALLIVPFFTAGLGTNILSHVILSERNYVGTKTLGDTLKASGKVLLLVIGCLLPFLLIAFYVYKKFKNKSLTSIWPPVVKQKTFPWIGKKEKEI